jgi:hypothetical protein
VEFLDRDFLPAGQAPRVIARRPDAPQEQQGQRQQTIQETVANRAPVPRAAGEIRPQSEIPRPGPPPAPGTAPGPAP